MSKYFPFILSLSLVLVVAATAPAAEKPFDPAARAKIVAPFIDEQTRLIVHVDLGRLQIEPCVEAIRLIMPPAFEPAMIRDELMRLKKISEVPGFSELYVVFNFEDLPTVPFFIMLPSPTDRPLEVEGDQLRIPFDNGRQYELRSNHLGNMVFFATPEKFERLKKLQTAPRPELAEAFTAAGDNVLQAILLSGDDDRRLIEELYPTLPEQLGGGPSTIVTQGLRWAALGISFPPKPQMQLTIQSRDEQAAQALADKIGNLFPNLAKSEFIFGKKIEQQSPMADALKSAARIKPSVEGDRIRLTLGDKPEETEAMGKLLAVPLAESLNAAWRQVTVENLKQIGLAMHNWHDAQKAFPAQANYAAAGLPLLSWRVHILPYLDESKLYKRFHLDEPWDSPNNIKLVREMPKIYAMPNSAARSQGRTCFVRPAGETTVCPGKEPVEIKQITDGTSNTIMVVEVDEQHAVIWTKPDDIEINLEQPANGLGGHFPGGFWTTFCDGSARFLESTIDAKKLRALFTRNGGEVVD